MDDSYLIEAFSRGLGIRRTEVDRLEMLLIRSLPILETSPESRIKDVLIADIKRTLKLP